jgi:HAE1 family hydrophobic/amphiphilic exporter-1
MLWRVVGGLDWPTVSVVYLLPARFVTPKAPEEARLKRELAEAAHIDGEPAH